MGIHKDWFVKATQPIKTQVPQNDQFLFLMVTIAIKKEREISPVQMIGGKKVSEVMVTKQMLNTTRLIQITPFIIGVPACFLSKNQFRLTAKNNSRVKQMLKEVIKSFMERAYPAPRSNL